MSKKITHIVVHCSDSSFGNAEIIDSWHKERGFSKIGYHYVILNGKIKNRNYDALLDGIVQEGRNLDDDPYIQGEEIGAHALGLNDCSVGICLIGIKMFSEYQLLSLISLVKELIEKYDISIDNIIGHYETEQSHGKTCPNFNMEKFRNLLKDEGNSNNIQLHKYYDKGDFNFI